MSNTEARLQLLETIVLGSGLDEPVHEFPKCESCSDQALPHYQCGCGDPEPEPEEEFEHATLSDLVDEALTEALDALVELSSDNYASEIRLQATDTILGFVVSLRQC